MAERKASKETRYRILWRIRTMMNKEKFKEMIYLIQEHDDLYDKLNDLGIDIINCKDAGIANVFFDEMMISEFGESGFDLIAWWLYEDVDHKIYAENGEDVIADLNNVDDLYRYLTEGGRDAVFEEE